MKSSGSRLERLRSTQPAAWSLLKFTAARGLAAIDGSKDRVTLTTELRRQSPHVHYVLGGAIEEWRRGLVAR